MFGKTTAISALLVAGQLATCNVHAGASIVIDRDALKLVAAGAGGCPQQSVRFVTEGAAIVAVCDLPPAPRSSVAAVEQLPGMDGEAVPPASPPPMPTWTIEPGKDIQATIKSWMPPGWTLAWDATSKPSAASKFSFTGDRMDALAELFDRRSIWSDAPPIACSFPKQKILQIRDAGVCGAP